MRPLLGAYGMALVEVAMFGKLMISCEIGTEHLPMPMGDGHCGPPESV
jgi:hypothetical protein